MFFAVGMGWNALVQSLSLFYIHNVDQGSDTRHQLVAYVPILHDLQLPETQG